MERKVFSDSVSALTELQTHTPTGLKVQSMRPEHLQDKMTLHFALSIPQSAHDELEARVARGEVVPLAELNSKYAVSQTETNPLVSWLKNAGYEITEMSKDGTSIYARATVAQIQDSLGVKMARVTRDGVTYTAAQNAPSLPSNIAGSVHAIGGLQPFRHAHRHNRRITPVNRNDTGLAAGAPAPNIANKPPYLVQEILKAYNGDGLPVTGKGQTVAILIDTFPADTDLKLFWKRNSVATAIGQIEKVNVKGGAVPPTEGEETLDVE